MEVGAHVEASSCSHQVERLFTDRPGPNRERLASVIFDDIVPRLQMLHHDLSAKDAESAFTPQEISDFGNILVDDDSAAVDAFLQGMRARGHSEETIFLGLMAETARHLGALWEDDSRTFIEVTIGIARMQKLLCVYSGACEPALVDGIHRVLLCALSGERHVFGLDMVACFMRHAAWEVDLRKECETQDVADAVGRERFAILGLTLSAEDGLESLCRTVQAARAASINAPIGVLVGGPLFRANPELAAQVGADAIATDAASASLLAKRLLLRQQAKHAAPHSHGAPQNDSRPARAGSGAQSFIQSSNFSNVSSAASIAARSR
jgi:MerR family transcriptional regulator, light-induced transcriptional regulator